MNIVLDLLLLALFAFFVIRGYHKGFFKSVLGFGRLILSIILTVIFGPMMAKWLDNAFIHPPIYDSVHEKLAAMAASASENTAQFLSDIKDKYGVLLDGAALEDEAESAGASMDAMVETYSTSISSAISGVISTVLGYVLFFILAFVALTIAIWLVSRITKLPILKQCDKLLGLLLGLLSALCVVTLLSTIFYGIIYATGNMAAYEDSILFKFLYDLHIFRFIWNNVF